MSNIHTTYAVVYMENFSDSYRWKFSEDDGMLCIEYQEHIEDENGVTWITKQEIDGLGIEDVDRVCAALKHIVAISEMNTKD